MQCFRYATAVLKGPWRASLSEALADALCAGQAYSEDGNVALFDFATIEEAASSRCCPNGLKANV